MIRRIILALAFILAMPSLALADTTISGLTLNSTVASGDYLVEVHSGTTYKTTVANLNSVFADLTSAQTIAGVKTFSSAPVMSGASITSGTIPLAALATAPVTAVTASGNVSSSGGTTPAITMSATPSFTSLSATSGMTAGYSTYDATSMSVYDSTNTYYLTISPNSSNIAMTGSGTLTFNHSIAPYAVQANATTTTSSFAAPLLFTNTAPMTMTTSVGIANDNGTINGLEFNVPTSSTNGFSFNVNGSTVAHITNAGALATGSSSYGPTGSTIVGPLYVQGTSGILYLTGLSSFSSPGLQTYGDITAQESASAGALILGGGTAAGKLDFGSTNSGAFTFSKALFSGIAYGTTYNAFSWPCSTGQCSIGANSGGSVDGVTSSALEVVANAVGTLAMDVSGDLGIKGFFSAPYIYSYANGSTAGYVPPIYTAAGAATGNKAHIVSGVLNTTLSSACAANAQCALTANSVTFSGSATFTGATTYNCTIAASYNSAWFSPAVANNATSITLYAVNVYGSSISSGTAVNIYYNCIGY